MNKNRVRTLKAGSAETGPVVYWMSRDQRTRDNWAILWAQEIALQQGVPLIVLFCLVPEFLNASQRQYGFMLKGLQDVENDLSKKNIPFCLLKGAPEQVVAQWLRKHGIKSVVTDFDPLRIKRAWKASVSERIGVPFYEIDAHNIVPCWVVSKKQEYGAYTIRPKIQRALDEYLEEFPQLEKHTITWKEKPSKNNWHEVMQVLSAVPCVPDVDWIKAGERAAHIALDAFIKQALLTF